MTDEQIASLTEFEINKKVSDYQNKFNKELLKVQSQLTEALSVVNGLLSSEVVVEAKKKLTDEEFVALFNQNLTNAEISKKIGYNSSYISLKKKKFIEKGLIK